MPTLSDYARSIGQLLPTPISQPANLASLLAQIGQPQAAASQEELQAQLQGGNGATTFINPYAYGQEPAQQPSRIAQAIGEEMEREAQRRPTRGVQVSREFRDPQLAGRPTGFEPLPLPTRRERRWLASPAGRIAQQSAAQLFDTLADLERQRDRFTPPAQARIDKFTNELEGLDKARANGQLRTAQFLREVDRLDQRVRSHNWRKMYIPNGGRPGDQVNRDGVLYQRKEDGSLEHIGETPQWYISNTVDAEEIDPRWKGKMFVPKGFGKGYEIVEKRDFDRDLATERQLSKEVADGLDEAYQTVVEQMQRTSTTGEGPRTLDEIESAWELAQDIYLHKQSAVKETVKQLYDVGIEDPKHHAASGEIVDPLEKKRALASIAAKEALVERAEAQEARNRVEELETFKTMQREKQRRELEAELQQRQREFISAMKGAETEEAKMAIRAHHFQFDKELTEALRKPLPIIARSTPEGLNRIKEMPNGTVFKLDDGTEFGQVFLKVGKRGTTGKIAPLPGAAPYTGRIDRDASPTAGTRAPAGPGYPGTMP